MRGGFREQITVIGNDVSIFSFLYCFTNYKEKLVLCFLVFIFHISSTIVVNSTNSGSDSLNANLSFTVYWLWVFI